MDSLSLQKPMIKMLLFLAVLFGAIFAYHIFKSIMMKRYLSQSTHQSIAVSTITASTQPWQPYVSATGSLRATLGVDVTTELAGMVRDIYFTPGDKVKKGDFLIKLNDDTEVAQLRSYQANAALAQITYDRDYAQYNIQAVSQATLDTDLANLKSQQAHVNEQQSVIAKKNIHAPFSGRLGICLVYPGQYLNPGDKIVTLQQLDPIFVDFYLPQQNLVNLQTGQSILFTTDTYPDKTFAGIITTLDPKVETNTRNIRVEATIHNPEELLLPGMFGQVEINTGIINHYITIPQNAVSFNSYGEIVYLAKDNVAKQTFVEVGDTKNNKIAVIKGIKEGDQVITSGQIKLKNGSSIQVKNETNKGPKQPT